MDLIALCQPRLKSCLMIAPMLDASLMPLLWVAQKKVAFSYESAFYMAASDFAVKNLKNFYCDIQK